VSEYQYYEFQTVDRRLTEKEMHELRLCSTRARITATSFVNEYNWGDFKGDSDVWMEKYFDGHLYFANWGTRILQLALPEKLLPEKTARLYCSTDVASARRAPGKLILRFISDKDGGYDEMLEGDGLLSSLLPLRDDIAGGDLRALYLGWLMGVQLHHADDGEIEPPVPPNLGKLSGVLSDFAEFLHIDRDLIAVAAEASPLITSHKPTRKELTTWLTSVPANEKDSILLDIMSSENPHAGASLIARFNRDRTGGVSKSVQPRRKAAELRAAAEERAEKGGRN